MLHVHRFIAFTLCFVLTSLAVGCKDEGVNPPATAKYLIGYVTDKQGNPVQGVGVHYIFTMDALSLSQRRDHPPPIITIQYVLLQASRVNLRIFRWCTEELIMTVVDTEQRAGTHAVTFEGSQMTNGVYVYRLSIGGSVTEGRIFMIHPDMGELINTRPLVTSNAAGKFSLSNEQFGFDIPFVRRSASGEILDTTYISPTIQIVLHKDGYQTLVQSLVIDRSKDLSLNFILRR